jgi:hypothetical protein
MSAPPALDSNPQVAGWGEGQGKGLKKSMLDEGKVNMMIFVGFPDEVG